MLSQNGLNTKKTLLPSEGVSLKTRKNPSGTYVWIYTIRV